MEKQFDLTDQQIAEQLKLNGRATPRQIADVLGLNDAVVRDRLTRLEANDLLRVTLMLDHRVEGFSLLAAVGIVATGRLSREVGEELARNPRISIVMLTSGEFDLELQIFARDLDDLDSFIENQISSVSGVSRIAVAIAREIKRYDYHWVPFA